MEEQTDFMDFQEELLATTRDAVDLAREYHASRKVYSHCFNQIVVLIQKANLYNSKKSLENKIAELLANDKYGSEANKLYEQMLNAEAEYKGLEQVVKAYTNHSMALMAILKQQTQAEISESVRGKYE